jgi:guanylate kinase
MQGHKAIIFSAPSGSGKTTIVKRLVQQNPDLEFSISACTRDRRGRQEENGKDYYFLSPEDFKSKIDNHQFVEWQEVYAGNFYGTLKSEIEKVWASGKNVIFDVDVKGGLNLKKYFGKSALAVFVKVPSIEVLEQRLRNRDTESEGGISRRLFKAKFEMTFEDEFDVTLLNQDLEESIQIAQQLYRNFAGPLALDPTT